MPDQDYILGVDIGGTQIKMLRLTREGTILDSNYVETEDNQIDDWPGYVSAVVEICKNLSDGTCVAMAISAPGLAAADNRSIVWMQGRLEALQGVDWTDVFRSDTVIPVLNDAHAALLGECWKGPASGYQNAIMITLGTGVGGAIMVNGELLQGAIGRAGHLGHTSLNAHGSPDIANTPGSLEDAIGNCTIQQRTDGRFQTTHDLVAAYENGEEFATKVWLESLHQFACGLVSFINIVDPEIIVLGGGITRAGDSLLNPLRAEMEKLEWKPLGESVPIVIASLGDLAGAYGAAYYALHYGKDTK